MMEAENQQYVKDICDLKINEIFRKTFYLLSLALNFTFLILTGISIFNRDIYLILGAFLCLILGVSSIKTSNRIPIQYIYELYDNQIVIIKVYEFNQKIILSTALTDCQKKLKFNSLRDAFRIRHKKDVFAIIGKSKNQILSFRVPAENRRYFIQPSEKFFKKLEGASHDISR